MDPNPIADQNVERLIQDAYQPEPVPPPFAAAIEAKLQSAIPRSSPASQSRWATLVLAGMAACGLIVWGIVASWKGPTPIIKEKPPGPMEFEGPFQFTSNKWTDDVREAMQPRRRPAAPTLTTLKVGDKLTTPAGKRQLVQLADGSRLYVNEKTQVEAVADRQLTLHKGQIYLEVAPKDGSDKFVVKTGQREVIATGTHFAVQSDGVKAGVVVTQGSVRVKGFDVEFVQNSGVMDFTKTDIHAGQAIEPGQHWATTAPRASHALEWTRELMAAAESPMVPACQHQGGALLALDPKGQEINLELRKYAIDVHIEDGFARTTIDQTYFNTTWDRLEGTFYFPLPADASLSRLAMYVADGNECKLMEGGMAERKHAADVYETIRYQRRDPALLEWLDGTTFKMRVFPLEAKQEKRIILSYTQKLPSLYGTTRYRFAGGHSLPAVREWFFTARIKSGAGMTIWSPTHDDLVQVPEFGDVRVHLYAKNTAPKADVCLEMKEKESPVNQDIARFASFLYENHQYVMLRYRPNLPSLPERKRRDWIVLFESSAQRDPLLAGTQVDVVRNLLRNAEYDDTFTLLTVNTQANVLYDPLVGVSGLGPWPKPTQFRGPRDIDHAIKFLQQTHLVGALDLQQGLEAAVKLAKDAKNPHIVHVGGGIPAIGERDAGKLAKLIPESVPYVGVGVGKRWNRAFMKAAAERTNGLFTQINPDETIAWRAFELLATLNTPRLLGVQVVDAAGKVPFLLETSMLAQGEELCAIARVDTSQTAVPGKVIVKGTLDGKAITHEFPVINVLTGAGYLPRMWAKQEIDRLLAQGAGPHKNEIIALSKAMYVMSPFTSLLVLETDADYERFKVDKGRKDHWAMYQTDKKIPLVYEPGTAPPKKDEPKKKKSAKPSVDEVLETIAGGRDTRFKGRSGFVTVDEDSAIIGLFSTPNAPAKIPPVLGFVGPEDIQTGAFSSTNGSFKPDLRFFARYEPTGFGNTLLGDRVRVLALPPAIDFSVPMKPGQQQAQQQAQLQLIDSETLGQMHGEWRRFWMNDQPSHLTPFRVHGGVGPASSALDDSPAPPKGVMPPSSPTWESANASISPATLQQLSANWGMMPPRERKRIQEAGIDQLSAERELRRLSTSMSLGLELPKATLAKPVRGGHGMKPEPMFTPGLFGDELRDELVRRRRPITMKGPDEVYPWEPTSLRYARPKLDYDASHFTNLVQYAPGLFGDTADVLAVLEAEAEIAPAKLGVIEPGARKLIDAARSSGWTALTIAAQGPLPSFKVYFNGAGQFAYEHVLISGLREQVIGDGKTLWHLYPEIGLASKRRFSRHHQHWVTALNPAFVPAAEELARGCEVKLVDGHTVALVPLSEPERQRGLNPSDPRWRSGSEMHVHLVFKDGQLVERRLVEMPAHKTLLRQIFAADGSIEWRGADDKTLAKQTRTLAPAAAPELTPRVDELVVVNLPLRTREHLTPKDHEPDLKTLGECLVTDCLTGQANLDYHGVARLFQQAKQRKLGYFVLLNAVRGTFAQRMLFTNDKDWYDIDLEKDYPENALAQFIMQGQREIYSADTRLLKKVPGPKDGFIQKLATFRNLWLTWQQQKPLLNGGKDMPLEKAKVMEFLEETTAPLFAYALIDVMQRRCNTAPPEQMLALIEKRLAPVSDPLGLGYLFRYEHARSLYHSGLGGEAAKRFRSLHTDALKYGALPPIDPAFRDSLQLPIGAGPRFIGFTRQTLDDLLGKKRYGLAFQLAKQMEQLGDEALSDEILTTILAKASQEERNSLTLVCVQFFEERKNYLQADRLLTKLLSDKKLTLQPQLWRWRAELTKQAGQTPTSIACLEMALDLEYAQLLELVNLESFRADYRTLLTHYQKIAEASGSLEKSATKTFLAKVIRTADRWRLVDPESAEPCNLAGKTLFLMGERDLAWSYWTTPIDLHPMESAPWLSLATAMKGEGDLEKADRAYAIAFEAEPTNPEILWQRAQNAVRMGQPDAARRLYRQIADGEWQERFQVTVEQARGLAR